MAAGADRTRNRTRGLCQTAHDPTSRAIPRLVTDGRVLLLLTSEVFTTTVATVPSAIEIPTRKEHTMATTGHLDILAAADRAQAAKLGSRNRAIVAFTWRTGLRIHETLLVRPVDVDAENNQVHVVRGKGGKERWSVIDDYGLEELGRWMTVRESLGFNSTQPLFCVIEGSNAGAHLNQSYVRLKLHEAARLAGVDKRVPPHQWRHSHALHLHRKGVPLAAISKQLGHSNVSTTSTYLSGMSSEEIRDHVLGAWK